MNLLELIGTPDVLQTTGTRKLTINGKTKTYPVYKIKLSKLYYNDQNDRIATWISKDADLGDYHSEEYNLKVQQYIYDSNPDAIEKTKNNIRLVDQREPGVVLCDGRLIDGNRRFTCLRMIKQEDKCEDLYFEAVILDATIEQNAKTIKMLELAIQHGEEGRVDYNLIDFAIGTYRDVVLDKLLTPKEYADSANETVGDVKKRIEVAVLLIEFLEYINAPLQYHIVRELNIYSIFFELVPLLKKVSVDEASVIKESVFNNIVFMTQADHRKYVREVKNLIDLGKYETFLSKEKDLTKQAKELINAEELRSVEDIKRLASREADIKDELITSLASSLNGAKRAKAKDKPSDIVEKTTGDLMEIDVGVLAHLDEESQKKFTKKLERIKKVVGYIESQVGDGDNVSEPATATATKIVKNDNLTIRTKSIQDPIVFVGNTSSEINGAITTVNLKQIYTTSDKQKKKYTICFVDEKYEIVSNVVEIELVDSIDIQINLNSTLTNNSKIYLCVKSSLCGAKEVEFLYEFTTKFIFDPEFIF